MTGDKILPVKVAACRAIDENVQNNQWIGIGSGNTIVHAVDRLSELVDQNSWSVYCVPTSYQARKLILSHNLPLRTLDEAPSGLDVAFDGADEINEERVLVKGGGGCLLQEKIIAFAARKLIIIGDETKYVKKLGMHYKNGIPLEVLPLAVTIVKRHIENTLGGEVFLREGTGKMGPVISDNGNFLMDWHFPSSLKRKWYSINNELLRIPGLLETGLFFSSPVCYIGDSHGKITVLNDVN